MSVRMALAEADTTAVVDAPHRPPIERDLGAIIGSGSRVEDVLRPSIALQTAEPGLSHPTPSTSRRALREARHHRRRLAALCMVVVAACLAATVLIVGIARDRAPEPVPVGSGVVQPASLLAVQLPSTQSP